MNGLDCPAPAPGASTRRAPRRMPLSGAYRTALDRLTVSLDLKGLRAHRDDHPCSTITGYFSGPYLSLIVIRRGGRVRRSWFYSACLALVCTVALGPALGVWAIPAARPGHGGRCRPSDRQRHGRGGSPCDRRGRACGFCLAAGNAYCRVQAVPARRRRAGLRAHRGAR